MIWLTLTERQGLTAGRIIPTSELNLPTSGPSVSGRLFHPAFYHV